MHEGDPSGTRSSLATCGTTKWLVGLPAARIRGAHQASEIDLCLHLDGVVFPRPPQMYASDEEH